MKIVSLRWALRRAQIPEGENARVFDHLAEKQALSLRTTLHEPIWNSLPEKPTPHTT